ncbi:peptidase C60, sortase A and B [Micromonospora sp. ATCC 39149]|uniref:Class F sortase n=1 Tax=Micromonospora carbonacea TaxID=47853 RepID=A0A7D6CDV0_9ACTN|nr:class F sortase [Micromonospora sp. ATCC 39149]EEP74414.1 peptidase C60, sortase A and B [Micromonospora sp. ATCC 39149]QLK00244.1 class F sortase [Micromonospora carbonacea]
MASPRTARSRSAPADGRRRSWSVPAAVVLVLLGVFTIGAGLGRAAGPLEWVARPAGRPAAVDDAPRPAVGRPVSLRVPAIRVSASVGPVGQAADGSIAVPPLSAADETGWYDRSVIPGEPGRAVIVGHVDTRDGPAVFYDLDKLRAGDRIEVTRADGSVAVFAVDSVEHFGKDDLPADRVYGDDGPPGLRLITCGGAWVGGRTGYADNVIAFASLLSPHP